MSNEVTILSEGQSIAPQTGRTVIVASTAANTAKRIQNFTGYTWADLKAIPDVQSLLVGNVEAILNPGNVTLGREDSALPDGDFKVFLVPTKNDADMTEKDASELGFSVRKMLMQAARVASTEQAAQLKVDLKNTIENFFDIELKEENGVDIDVITFNEEGNSEETTDSDLQAALNEARDL